MYIVVYNIFTCNSICDIVIVIIFLNSSDNKLLPAYSWSIIKPSTRWRSFPLQLALLKERIAFKFAPPLCLISKEPSCSIHNWPTSTLCSIQLIFCQVYASFHLHIICEIVDNGILIWPYSYSFCFCIIWIQLFTINSYTFFNVFLEFLCLIIFYIFINILFMYIYRIF